MSKEKSTSGTSFLNNIKIGTRLVILVVVLLIPTIVLGGLGIYGINNTNSGLKSIYNDRLVPTGQFGKILEDMESSMLQVHLGTKHDQRLSADEQALHADHTILKHTGAIKKKIENINKIYGEYLKSNLNDEEKKLSEEFTRAKNEFITGGLDKAITYMERGDFVGTNIHSAMDLPRLYNKAAVLAQKIFQLQLDRAQTEKETADQTYLVVLTINISSIVGGVIVSVLLSIFLIRSITVPLYNVVERIRDIAEGEGDLTKRLDADSRDEMGTLAEWMNRFIEKVQGIVKQIAENTENVFESAGELSESSQSLSAGTEQMSTQSQSIATSATEMNQNFQVISSSVEEMSISIQEVAKKSADASSVAGQADLTANTANEMISRLGVDAQDIGKVIESIVGIANQTNLLALNASIEAAGAGDAGKGFAVVAAEVKELARQAGESSEDIKGKIGAIQGSTEKAVASIGEINDVIKQVNDISGAIASAVEEQSITAREVANNVQQATNAANDVAKNIEGISQASQEGARNAARSSELASNLNKYAGKLREIVNQFRI